MNPKSNTMDDPEAISRLLSLRERMAKQEKINETVTREFSAPQIVSLDRRRAIGGRKVQIKEMRSRQQQILRMDIKGVPQVEIAEYLGITPTMVSIVQNSDIYRAEKATIHAEITSRVVTEASQVKNKILQLSGHAIDELEEILRDKFTDSKLKADVAFDILDRAGHKPTQQIEVVSYKDKLQVAYLRRKERLEKEKAESEANAAAVDAEFTPIEGASTNLPALLETDDEEPRSEESPPQ